MLSKILLKCLHLFYYLNLLKVITLGHQNVKLKLLFQNSNFKINIINKLVYKNLNI